ncbi:MAG TPA: amidohydrolase family protein [Gemmatimonadaceae bacterium]|nr:amidohydrolase family protein [Gemmatimonadaceae bacterium]
MIVDCHVHLSAFTPGHGYMSRTLLDSLPFRFMRWKFGLVGEDVNTERTLEELLARTVAEANPVNAAVVLAFDAVHDAAGKRDAARTHFEVGNDYVRDVTRKYPGLLYGASIHPYRRDAVQELERVARDGAVLIKWLPITQDIDPSDARCVPFYEALADLKIPLLSHTGWERTLPTANAHVADPALLTPALERGVTVIMAHCGTKSFYGESCHVDSFMRMAREWEHCYGDTSALNLPTRSYGWRRLLEDDVVRDKLVHGSDWPILPLPPLRRVGLTGALALLREKNWMKRDALVKQRLGLEGEYWTRAGRLLRRK